MITPNLCHDGHDAPCVDGEPGGLASADEWLKKWVPAITESPPPPPTTPQHRLKPPTAVDPKQNLIPLPRKAQSQSDTGTLTQNRGTD